MRIRSIKPEFWRSTDIAALPRDVRLLFIGLWSYVDDNGVGVDDYRAIAADLFALEDDPVGARKFVHEGLATLSRALLIQRYTVDGKQYLFIPTWDKHQKVDRPSKPRLPRPSDTPGTRAERLTSDNADTGDVSDGDSRESIEGSSPGAGEQGNRGTGEQGGGAGKRAPRATRIPDDFTVTADMVSWARKRVPDVDGRHETEKFLNYWQSASGKNSLKRDWTAAWRNWMLKASEQPRASTRASTRSSPATKHPTDAGIEQLLGNNNQQHALPAGDQP